MAEKGTVGFLRRIGLWVGMALLALLLSGCGGAPSQEQTPDTEPDTTVEEDNVYLLLYLPDDFDRELGPEEEDPSVPDSGSTVVAAVSREEVSAESIVQAYNDLVIEPEYGEQIEILDVQTQDNQVRVDFDSESVNLLHIEEGDEGPLFYSLARSIVSNLSGIDEIYFTMDNGQDFTLRHLWFEADRPFYYGNVPQEEGGGEIGPD